MSNASDTKQCQHVEIASSSVGGVAVCAECAMIQLTVGDGSMRLSHDAFVLLAQMVSRARTKIERDARSKAAPRLPLSNPHPYLH